MRSGCALRIWPTSGSPTSESSTVTILLPRPSARRIWRGPGPSGTMRWGAFATTVGPSATPWTVTGKTRTAGPVGSDRWPQAVPANSSASAVAASAGLMRPTARAPTGRSRPPAGAS